MASTDGSSSPTGPPSAPQNLSSSASGTQLSLRWEPPADMGGRQDVRYSVRCSQCQGTAQDGGPCQPCGVGVHFSPGARGLTTSAVHVSGLEPYANYTFNVEAQNGVSGLGSSGHASTSVSISMGHAGERLRGAGTGTWLNKGSRPQGQIGGQELRLFPFSLHIQPYPSGPPEPLSGLSLRLVKKEPRQLELTWAGSRPRSPGGNLSYELHVLNQVRILLRDSLQYPCPAHPNIPSLGCGVGGIHPKSTVWLSQDKRL